MTAPDGALEAIVGHGHVLTDPDLTAPYEHDPTGRHGGRAAAVVRPADAGEVSRVLAACRERGIAVVCQGGGTGLVGGQVPRGGEVVLSLRRLDGIGPVDDAAGQVTVGAGTTLAALQSALRGTRWAFGVDFGARSAATIGGMAATNAGGAQVLRHGPMRAQVLGLEAVLADGSILRRLSGLLKDTAGYDLPQLLVGSEGTLAAITAARLRLVPALAEVATALLAVPDTATAARVAGRLRERLASLQAAELFYADGLALVCAHRRLRPPFAAAHPAYLLVECGARTDPLPELAAALEDAEGVLDVAAATDAGRRAALWTYREALTEAVSAAGIPHKLDVSVPLAELARFERRVRETVQAVTPGARTILWGHAGDGNLHVNVLGPPPDEDAVDAAVLGLVARLGGSISAEHGVGVAKRTWLALTRSPEEIAAMAAIKRALDPAWILNPGVVLPA